MTRLAWNEDVALWEDGLDRGVLYLDAGVVVWDGLMAIEEKAVGNPNVSLYFDSKRMRLTQETGTFEAVLEAFTYPDPFEPYLGYDDFASGQHRSSFGMSYRTQEEEGYRLNLVYNAIVTPLGLKRTTLGAATAPLTFKWDIHTTPMEIPGAKPGSRLMVRTHDARYPDAVSVLEDILYGTDETSPRLPSPSEVIDLFESYTIFRITYHGDGTFTASGPDTMVYFSEPGSFVLDAPTVLIMEDGAYQASSY